MAGIILRFSPASIIASAWSARESEKQVRVGGIIPDEIHASDLSEERCQESLKCGEVFCARSIVPFEGSRWRLRWMAGFHTWHKLGRFVKKGEKAGQSPAEEFATLAHELAHEMMHRDERRNSTSKRSRETEAEAVAFVVCHATGLETGSASRDYKTLQRKGAIKFRYFHCVLADNRWKRLSSEVRAIQQHVEFGVLGRNERSIPQIISL